MSESGSIMFYEQSDHGSVKSIVPPGSRSHSQPGVSSKPLLNRPPLHHAARQDLPQQTAQSLKGHRSSTSSRAAVVRANQEDATSDDTESIQFHTDAASHNMSLASMPVLPYVKIPPTNTLHDGLKCDSHPSGPRQSEGPTDDGVDDSIYFHVEGTSSLQQQDVPEPLHSPRNDSILFDVIDDLLSEEPVTKVPKGENKHTTATQDPSPHRGDSSSSTVVFDRTNGGEVNAEARSAVSDARNQDSVPHTFTQATVANPSLPSSAKAVASSIKDKTEEKPPLKGTTFPLGSTQGISSTEEGNKVTTALAMPSRAGAPKGKKIPSAPLSSQRNVQSNSIMTEGKCQDPLRANTQGNTKKYDHVAARSSVYFDEIQPPARNFSGGTRPEQQKRRPERNDSLELLSPSDEPSPSTARIRPIPYPDTIDAPSMPSFFTLEDGILQAKMDTEHWRMFNDIQREEIAAIVQRIIEARKSDTLPDVLEALNRRQAKEAATLGGFVDVFNKKGITQEKNNIGSTRTVLPMRSSGGTYTEKMRPPPVVHVSSPQYPSSLSHTTRARERHAVSPKNDTQTFKRKMTDGGVFSFRSGSPQWDAAAARMAQSLSIVWPPKSKDALFFITGSRLTQRQCDEFYEAVTLQASASERVLAEVQRGTKKMDAIERKRQNLLNKKPVATRTTILRKAFSLMDIDQKGVILATDLPAMKRLLEAECEHVGEIANGGTTPRTVLKCARAEQRKLKGTIDARRPSAAIKQDDAFSSLPSASPVLESLLYTFVLDIILPLLTASGFLEFDFTTVGLLVFGSVGLGGINANPDLIKWRHAALRFFETLT